MALLPAPRLSEPSLNVNASPESCDIRVQKCLALDQLAAPRLSEYSDYGSARSSACARGSSTGSMPSIGELPPHVAHRTMALVEEEEGCEQTFLSGGVGLNTTAASRADLWSDSEESDCEGSELVEVGDTGDLGEVEGNEGASEDDGMFEDGASEISTIAGKSPSLRNSDISSGSSTATLSLATCRPRRTAFKPEGRKRRARGAPPRPAPLTRGLSAERVLPRPIRMVSKSHSSMQLSAQGNGGCETSEHSAPRLIAPYFATPAPVLVPTRASMHLAPPCRAPAPAPAPGASTTSPLSPSPTFSSPAAELSPSWTTVTPARTAAHAHAASESALGRSQGSQSSQRPRSFFSFGARSAAPTLPTGPSARDAVGTHAPDTLPLAPAAAGSSDARLVLPGVVLCLGDLTGDLLKGANQFSLRAYDRLMACKTPEALVAESQKIKGELEAQPAETHDALRKTLFNIYNVASTKLKKDLGIRDDTKAQTAPKLTRSASLSKYKPFVPREPAASAPGPAVNVRLLSDQWRVGQPRPLMQVRGPAPKSPALIVHFHGGGFVAHSSRSHEVYLRAWAQNIGVPILSVDYSLAPEAPYPAALDECYFAYTWALQNAHLLGSTAERVVVCGDSAGGNLCTAVALRCAMEGVRMPDAVVASYPALNLNWSPSPARLLSLFDPLLPQAILQSCVIAYVGMKPRTLDPLLSPLVAPDDLLRKLPPMYILACGLDPLLDDALEFARRLMHLGKKYELRVVENAPHGVLNFRDLNAVTKGACHIVESWLKQATAVTPSAAAPRVEGDGQAAGHVSPPVKHISPTEEERAAASPAGARGSFATAMAAAATLVTAEARTAADEKRQVDTRGEVLEESDNEESQKRGESPGSNPNQTATTNQAPDSSGKQDDESNKQSTA
eukprot:m.105208 g.105208  ORF g.105208 m.105208 type:complete len:902 (+) comp14194_c6_seq2:225-2930(+)